MKFDFHAAFVASDSRSAVLCSPPGEATRRIAELNMRAHGEGVRSIHIVCDEDDRLGDRDARRRAETISEHHKRIDTAKTLGRRFIRVNTASNGSRDEQMKLVPDGLQSLSEHGANRDTNVIVENHGGCPATAPHWSRP